MKRNTHVMLAPLAAAVMLALAPDARAVDDFNQISMPPGGTNTTPLAVSGNGSTVVGIQSGADGTRGFVWTLEGGMQVLPFVDPLPGGPSSFHYARAADVSFRARRSARYR